MKVIQSLNELVLCSNDIKEQIKNRSPIEQAEIIARYVMRVCQSISYLPLDFSGKLQIMDMVQLFIERIEPVLSQENELMYHQLYDTVYGHNIQLDQ